MASSGEMGCTYAALVLADEGLEITGEKLTAILSKANVKVEGFLPGLFAKALDGVDVKNMLANVGAGGGGGGGGGGGAAAAAAPAGDAAAPAEAKKEEPEESEEEDMDMGLFD
eukprot:m.20044 g.20044  ORF g.20044 m.20044 type:complete len:113 (-) comp12015_c0_seq1:80-418(-)